MNDLVSIVVPIYKAENFVANLINDVLAQTYQNWELILVSNGPNREKQEDICRQYALADNRIKLFVNDRAGTSIARNRGIENANGKWLTFLDVDDRITPKHLQNYLDVVEDNVDIVIGGFTECSVSGKETLRPMEQHDSVIEGPAFYDYLLSCHDYLQGMNWNKLYNADVFRESGIRFHEDIVHIEDAVLNYELFLYCHRIITIPMTGYKYIRYSDSTTGRYTPSFEKSFGVYRKLYVKLCKLAGYSEDKIKQILLRKMYIETYIFVINLFRLDCPLFFGEKVRKVESLLNNHEFICSKRIVDIQENKLNLKIFNFFVKMQSPLLMSIGYTILFRVKGCLDLLKKKLCSKNRS
jgi:glycosyltransferase involved in cell wall biosynthesis